MKFTITFQMAHADCVISDVCACQNDRPIPKMEWSPEELDMMKQLGLAIGLTDLTNSWYPEE